MNDKYYYFAFVAIVFIAILTAVGFTYSGYAIAGSGVLVKSGLNSEDCGFVVNKIIPPDSWQAFSVLIESDSSEFLELEPGEYTLVFQPKGVTSKGEDCYNLYEEQVKTVVVGSKSSERMKVDVDFIYNPLGDYNFKIGITEDHCSAAVSYKKIYSGYELWFNLGIYDEGQLKNFKLPEGVNYLKFVPQGNNYCLKEYRSIDKVVNMDSNGLVEETIVFPLKNEVKENMN